MPLIKNLNPIRFTCPCLLLLGLALLIQPSLQAQSKAPVLSFRLLSLAGSYGGIFYEQPGSSKLHGVTLDQGLSRYYRRSPGPKLEIFREFPVPPGSPPGTKPVRKAGLIADIPPNVSRCVIVTIPRSSNRTDLLTSHTLPDDNPRHKAGTILAANYSSSPSVIAIDKSQYPIEVGATRIITLPEGVSEYMIQIALNKQGTWASVYKSGFSKNPQHRGYLIFADFVQDPDFKPSAYPPPALVTTAFEVSPEVPRKIKKSPTPESTQK